MTAIYHITNINNLPDILRYGGLFCDSEMDRRGIKSVCIAYGALKERRAKTRVPVAAAGTLADYVPFYFCPRSPMLYAIHCGSVENYQRGQNEIIHLVSSVEKNDSADRRWCFTDGHAVEAITSFYETLNDLDKIDWNVTSSWSWGNKDNDLDRKRRKQAEFLTHEFFPWDLVDSIGVMDNNRKSEVERMMESNPHQPPVAVMLDWYYI
jgi:hypothetical protein